MPDSPSWDDVVKSDNDNKPTTQKNTQKQVTDRSDSIADDIRELISQLSPSKAVYAPSVVAAYINQKLGRKGFSVFDDWYKSDTNYPGPEDSHTEYTTHAHIKHSVDKSTIQELIDDIGDTETTHTDKQTEQLEKNDNTVIKETEPTDATDNKRPAINFDKNSLTGKSDTLKTQLLDQVDVIQQLAILGNLHYFFGAPNTGKTLLIIALLLESIQSGRIKASDVFYFNLDDSLHGLFEKVEIFEELGVQVISDGHEGFNVSKFPQMLDELTRRNQAHGIIIILDTLKKFVDVMNKSQVREWNRILRRFTLKGGTVIALAHVNKNPGSSGKNIPAGVADLVDDCDTAYIISKVNTDEETQLVTIEFENIKQRGNVANLVAFSYSTDPVINYEERLASVESLDQARLEQIKMADSLKADDELISVTTMCIEQGFTTKMRLRDEISKRTGISKRKALQHIEKYTGTDPDNHKWSFTTQEHGRKVYSLLTGDTDAE